jgi:adenylate kinase family enzyme
VVKVRDISISHAKDILQYARHVLVIGCSGGGKTTLALNLAKRYKLPYQSLDGHVRWNPGWQRRDKREQRHIIQELVRQDRWIQDGTGSSTADIRFPKADLIIWVRMPRWRCFWGLGKRLLFTCGRTRAGMPDHCPEKLPDREFLSYIWNFEKQTAPFSRQRTINPAPNIPVVTILNWKAAIGLQS